MKRLIIIMLALAPLLLQACQGSGASEKDQKDQKQAVKTDKEKEKAVIHLTSADFRQKIMDYRNNDQWNYKGNKPCLIDFYADWCGPCRITSPIIEDLAKQYAGKINVYKVDVDKEKELASVMGIRSIPTFLYCPVEGKPRMSSGIAQSKEETKNMFIENIEQLLLNN